MLTFTSWHYYLVPTAVTLLVLSGCQAGKGTAVRPAASLFSSLRIPPRAESARMTEMQTLDIQLALARTMEQKGEFDRATAIYRDALKTKPGHTLAAHRLAVISDRQGACEDSTTYFALALESQPENADVLCDYGYSLYRQQRWSEAEARFRQALAADPHHRRTHNNLGLLLARTGRRTDALVAFRQAGCGTVEAQMNLALALALEGQIEDAREQLERVRDVQFVSWEAAERIAQLEDLIVLAPAETMERSRGRLADHERRPTRFSLSRLPPK